MTRIKSRQPATTFYERPRTPRKRDLVIQSGLGPFADAYPSPGDHDYRALLAEQLSRDRELTDLPDINPADFETAAEYEQWLAEGARRFSV